MAEQRFLQIEDYGLIGDMHTCALVSKEGSIDLMCWPKFDSPSVFCRLLDGTRGGHWSVRSVQQDGFLTKQQYLAASNVLQTRWINEDGVVAVNDFFVVESKQESSPGQLRNRSSILARRLEGIRGKMKLKLCVCPVRIMEGKLTRRSSRKLKMDGKSTFCPVISPYRYLPKLTSIFLSKIPHVSTVLSTLQTGKRFSSHYMSEIQKLPSCRHLIASESLNTRPIHSGSIGLASCNMSAGIG